MMENMERIPCEYSIKIEYSNLTIGDVTSRSQLYAAVEGDLLIFKDNELIFSDNGVLLLELAKEFNNWLGNQQEDFEYYSMDYEDGPILFFKEKTGNWSIGGVWIDGEYSEVKISEIADACRKFITDLLHDLSLKGIDVDFFYID